MVLGEGMNNPHRKKNNARYGTLHERMTSPGREALREYVATPPAKQRKKNRLIKS